MDIIKALILILGGTINMIILNKYHEQEPTTFVTFGILTMLGTALYGFYYLVTKK